MLHHCRNDPLCGGALLTKNYVITAAHCFTDDSAQYYVLLNDYSKSENNSVQVEYEVADIKVHPDFRAYRDGLFHNDVALVELKTPAGSDFNSFICLPGSSKHEFGLG